MTDMDRKLLETYNLLKKDPDRSKTLSVHAMLAYDDGREYTKNEYQKAIKHLEEGIAQIGDTEDHFLAKAIHWCKTRLNATQPI